MKKIMFNDKYGLTQAVLEGRKTQTRRIAYDFRKHVNHKVFNSVLLPSGNITYMDGKVQVLDEMPKPHYKVGEEVAVAQRYSECHRAVCLVNSKGWYNKMFVAAEFMPHRIKITNIRVERLQDISEEDCLKEGVVMIGNYKYGVYGIWDKSSKDRNAYIIFDTPKQAFAALIDKTCGKGTWESNPWVFVYDFELIK